MANSLHQFPQAANVKTAGGPGSTDGIPVTWRPAVSIHHHGMEPKA
jgi:hypothetical protein